MTVEDNILASADRRSWSRASRYRERRAQHRAWNAQQRRASSAASRITPVKFGISFTATFFNQAGALVHVYTDGSVQVNHGGTEMGQGLHTKVAQIVADELGVPFERVRITRHRHRQGAQRLGDGRVERHRPQWPRRAVRGAPRARATSRRSSPGWTELPARARSIFARRPGDRRPTRRCSFDEVVEGAYANRASSCGATASTARPRSTTTRTRSPAGRSTTSRTARPAARWRSTRSPARTACWRWTSCTTSAPRINPAIDIGQIEGGFIQGMGWLTTEQLVWNDKGLLATHAPSTYKIPADRRRAAHFNVELWPEANREDNVGGSKAVGEPPFMLAISVWEALRDAVAAARGDGQGAHGCAGDGGERAAGSQGLRLSLPSPCLLPPPLGEGWGGGARPVASFVAGAPPSRPPPRGGRSNSHSVPLRNSPSHAAPFIPPHQTMPPTFGCHVTPARPLHLPRCAYLRAQPRPARASPHGRGRAVPASQGAADRLAALDDAWRARGHHRRTRDRA